MRTQATVADRIDALLTEKNRTWKWLSRETGIEYKRLLRQAKNCVVPLSLEHAALIADALEVDLASLISKTQVTSTSEIEDAA